MEMDRIAAFSCAIAMISNYRVSDRGALSADLVVAAGMKLDPKKRRLLLSLFDFERKERLLGFGIARG